MGTITIDQIRELLRQDEDGRANRKNFQQFLENPDRYNTELGRFGKLYPLTVHGGDTFKHYIKKNKFNYVNEYITSANFPFHLTSGTREIVCELYEFDQVVAGEEAEKIIEADGYQLEPIEVLLAFGLQYPKEQLRRPIVCLRSQWRAQYGGVEVPYLDWNDDERTLSLCCLDDEFYLNYRFLVSRK